MKFRFSFFALCFFSFFAKTNAQSITSFSSAGIYEGNTLTGSAMYGYNLAPRWFVNATGGNYDSVVLTLSGFSAGDSILIWGMNPNGSATATWTNFQVRNRQTNSTWYDIKTSAGTNYVTYKSGMVCYGIEPGNGKSRVVFDFKTKYNNTSTTSNDRLIIAIKSSGATNTKGSLIEFFPIVIPYRNAYRWSGAKGANWQTATNWTPNRTSVKDSDILVIQQINPAEINIPYNSGQFKQTITSLILDYSCTAVLTNYSNGNGAADKSVLNFTNYAPDASLNLMWNSSFSIGGTDSIEFHFPSATQQGVTNGYHLGTTNSLGNGARAIFSGGGYNLLSSLVTCDSTTSIRYAIGDGYSLYFPPMQSSNIGGKGEIIIDKGCEAIIDGSEGMNDTIKLHGKLSIYGILKIIGTNSTLRSNAPNSSSATDWNKWTPYLQFKNNGTKRGILKAVDGSSVINGGALWEMYNSGTRAWRTIGMPFKNGVNLSQISDNIVITGTNSGNNKDSFNSFGANCSYCKPSAWYWDETTGAWADYQSGNTANKVEQGSGLMLFFRGLGNNGLGNPTASATPGAIDIKGAPFLGSVTKNLSYTSTAGSLKGYNLISNPYLSNIDFTALSRTNVANKYLIYEPKAKTYNVYDNTGSSLSLTGSSTFQSSSSTEATTIEMGSSFFVIATGSSASIAFDESNKTTSVPKISAFKSTTDLPCNQLKTKISYSDTIIPLMDRFMLEWDMENKGASHDLDFMDLNKLYAGYLGIGSVSPSGQWLGVDRRPELTYDSALRIPLKIKTLDSNFYSLSFQTCPDNSASSIIYLKDKVTNKSIEVKNESVYQFNTKVVSEFANDDRFELSIVKRGSNAVSNVKKQSLNFSPNPLTENALYCNISGKSMIENFELLTLDGRKCFERKNIHASFVNVNLPSHISNGIYILKISTSTQETISQKIEILRD